MRSATTSALVIILVMSQAGCRSPVGSASSDLPPAPVPVEGVKLTPQSLQLSAVGDSLQLAVVVMPDSATDKALTWESGDTTIVTVNAAGLITARGPGAGVFVTVFTHDGHHQASVNVSVAQ